MALAYILITLLIATVIYLIIKVRAIKSPQLQVKEGLNDEISIIYKDKTYYTAKPSSK